jgi:glyoxylase-like metal-dependent hydrolase (beta-lactamase superfamily II)
MPVKQIVPGFYQVGLGAVNVFLFEGKDGLVLFDAGMPGHGEKILDAVREIGKQPSDIKHIVLTHSHPDHFGGLATVQRATNATTYAHPLEIPWVKKGGDFYPNNPERMFTPSPGFMNNILFRLFIKPYHNLEPGRVDTELKGGERLDFADNMQVIFAPGHSIGQLAFFWEKHGGLLFAADAAANMPSLALSLGYEDLEEGKKTLKMLSDYDFNIAAFGHGGAITEKAGEKWRSKWGKL